MAATVGDAGARLHTMVLLLPPMSVAVAHSPAGSTTVEDVNQCTSAASEVTHIPDADEALRRPMQHVVARLCTSGPIVQKGRHKRVLVFLSLPLASQPASQPGSPDGGDPHPPPAGLFLCEAN